MKRAKSKEQRNAQILATMNLDKAFRVRENSGKKTVIKKEMGSRPAGIKEWNSRTKGSSSGMAMKLYSARAGARPNIGEILPQGGNYIYRKGCGENWRCWKISDIEQWRMS